MILSYSKPSFKADILTGIKKHTLREDNHNRWKPEMKIHHWMHNPRNVKKNPHQFGEDECKATQLVWIFRTNDNPLGFSIWVANNPMDRNRKLSDDLAKELITNDGLTIEEFKDWFLPDGKDIWTGKIIHWTDIKY